MPGDVIASVISDPRAKLIGIPCLLAALAVFVGPLGGLLFYTLILVIVVLLCFWDWQSGGASSVVRGRCSGLSR